MDITIYPKKLYGSINVVPSKSQLHRLLICAAFSDKTTSLICEEAGRDIEATVNCLNALGANIRYERNRYVVDPVTDLPKTATLFCGESGSTLRFLLPIVGALGIDATFKLEGRLPLRPLLPLWEEMERMGCTLSWHDEYTVHCHGSLRTGNYTIPGNISSQYISGFLFAMALMDGTSKLSVTGSIESEPYVKMTQDALARFGVTTKNYTVTGCRPFHSPGVIAVEGDWSNGAYFLTANSIGSNITVDNLPQHSSQGDAVITSLLPQLSLGSLSISGKNIPDLIPTLSIAAAANHGAVFTNIERLRLKESDRIESIVLMLQSMGIHTETTGETLVVYPGGFCGCTIDTFNDHRIAMSAAIAASVATGPITILNAQCVDKSYPSFWEEYRKLGGSYEQHLR